MVVCDVAEATLVRLGVNTPADRKAYMREYMRKRRAKLKPG